jgi:serine/threonine-protein kinase
VTGKNPFEDIPSGELMGRVANPTIPPLNSVEPLCPAALSDAVTKVLSVDPAQRFQSAEELRGKLQVILQDIDPTAGAESTSRFMRDAFAAEYTAERRMLNTVKEQARALQPDEELEPPSTSEEDTAQNAPSPFATRPTPVAMPAITMEDETPAASRAHALQPEALSFAPTPKAGGASSRGDVHEKETHPAIQLKPDPPAPAPVRARVLTKSFDVESTEAATPAIAEPTPPPSIMVDGLPSQTRPSRAEGMAAATATELELPAQAPPPSPPKVAKKAPAPPKGGTAERKAAARPAGRGGEDSGRKERTAERKVVPRAPAPTPPPPVQRTDTMIITNPIADAPPPAAVAPKPARKGGAMWAWFVIPAIAIAAVAGFIAWDQYSDQLKQQAVDDAEADAPQVDLPPEPPKPEAPAAEPKAVEPGPSAAPAPAEVKPAPKSAPKAPKKPSGGGGSPGQLALRALQADFEKLVDEGVQRKFRLRLTEFEGQVDAKGDDPAFVQKVEGVHEQVKAALAKQ